MEQVLSRFKTEGLHTLDDHQEVIDLHIPKIPEITIDNTDRSRTSPFPFTGNKFEFRAVGSSANCSASMTVLNAIVANQLVAFGQELDKHIAGGVEKHKAIITVLQQYIAESEKSIFNGDGYSAAWEQEAEARGLENKKTTPEALAAFISDKNAKMLTGLGIFTEREILARYEVMLEQYIKQVEIEALVAAELAQTFIIPGANHYLGPQLQTLKDLHSLGINSGASHSESEAKEVFAAIDDVKGMVKELRTAAHHAHEAGDSAQIAAAFASRVWPLMASLREVVDGLEGTVDDNCWKLPKYRELLFLR